MTNKFFDRNSIQAWTPTPNLGITRLSSSIGLKYVNNEFNEFGGFLYNQNKNYQFITSVTGSSTSTLSIKLSAPFNAGIVSDTRSISTTSGVQFYTYANPISTEYSNDIIKYGATAGFIGSYIKSSNINEIDFLINGYREFIYLDKVINHPDQPNGWCYETPTIGASSYNWYFSSSTSVISPSYSIFGSGLEVVSSNNDYIAALINYDYFNLDFNFNFSGGNSDDSINIFLVNQSDLKLRSSWGNPFDSLTTSGTFSYVNLSATNTNGTKKYLVFSPSMVGTRTSTYMGILSNISIVGGYNPLNNLQVLPATSSTINNIDVDIPESIYTFDSVTNGVTYSLSSKIGNGHFKAGIWENGVWNNGWRDDTEAKDFDDIYSSILYAYDISWKIKISGSVTSCSSFIVGDKVAIGNIVAIDINENRKLIRDYYTITDIGKYTNPDNSETNWIEVSLDTTFPYRRIERDSPNHKIKVTKNVWLSGAFFNGYFSGVWNNGLFKGYPKITEMFDTHWIDGFFNGGHFNSNYPNYYFSDIKETTNCNYNNITLVFEDVLVSGNFINGTPDDYKPGHNLLPGDYITIDKDPSNVWDYTTNTYYKKIYNPEYNGICRVMSVSGNNVVVNKKHLDNLSVPQIGKVTRYAASGLIQNFKFYDTNKSKLKSNESSISSSIFSFNSWIDTNYDTTRSVTLGRDFRSYEPLTGKSFNRNNLYGYPTYDVLSSASRFRNSFDLDYGLYKLGTKYKLFNDFIGDASGFNEPFNPAEPTITNFYNAGWTFSTRNTTDLLFNRSEAVISSDNAINKNGNKTTIQDYIDSGVTGNELYLTATNSGGVLNNNKITTKNSRYTVVEFDVVTYSITDSKFTQTNQTPYEVKTIISDSILQSVTQSAGLITTATSSYNQIVSIPSTDIINIAVKINLDCTGSDLGNITINLKSPAGKIINIKNSNGFPVQSFNLTNQIRLINTVFDISSTTSLSTGTSPYSGTFSMEKINNKGTTGYISDSINISELFTNSYSNAQGDWTIYVQNDNTIFPTFNWSFIIKYKSYIQDSAIEITPSVDIPVLHFNNLNYEISSQPTGDGQSISTYKRMSYLPITQNINHLLTQNSFRFDSIEKTSAERTSGFGTNTIKKKYEYFYNKTDLMMTIQGNGEMGASQSMLVIDNIKMYETDMIPFFKYFEDVNIYKGIQVPYEGIAPNIDYLNSDFVFVDNITLGLDSINNTIIDNNFVCVPSVLVIATSSVIVTTATSSPSSITQTSAIVGGSITTQGVITQDGGVLVGTNNPLEVDSVGNIVLYPNIVNNVPFSGLVSGLQQNTTYNVRAYVRTYEIYTTGGASTPIITYGATTSFTTVATPPDYSVVDYSPTDYSN